MATKTGIQNLINTNLASGIEIVATDHREVENAFVSELYADEVLDTDATTNVVTKNTSVYPASSYDIRFVKRGNSVNVYGVFNTDSNFIGYSGTIINITNTLYLPKHNVRCQVTLQSNNEVRILELRATGEVICYGSMPVEETIYINFNYQTNE